MIPLFSFVPPDYAITCNLDLTLAQYFAAQNAWLETSMVIGSKAYPFIAGLSFVVAIGRAI